MRILITGGCGFLGSHLVEHFLKTTDHEIVVLDKLTYASSGFDRLRDVSEHMHPGIWVSQPPAGSAGFPRRLHVIGCDLSQPLPKGVIDEAHGTVGNGGIDYIIHAAAESHVDNSISDPLPFLMSNVIGTHHLLTSELTMGVERTFIVSTDEVYGPAPWDHPGFNEDTKFRPANPYAASKAGAECVAFAYANTYGLPITIVNTMNLIGERQHPEKFVPLVIRKVLAGETVTIHADPTKTRPGTRFYLHCRTFANALGWLIEDHDANGRFSSAHVLPPKIHVCGEREMSNLELAQAIADFVGKPLKYELVDFHSSRPGHDLRYAMDDSAIRGLGWRRPMGIMDSLKKTVAWYLANPRWLELAAKPVKPLPWTKPVIDRVTPDDQVYRVGDILDDGGAKYKVTQVASDGTIGSIQWLSPNVARYAHGEVVEVGDVVLVNGQTKAGSVMSAWTTPPGTHWVRVDLGVTGAHWHAVTCEPKTCSLLRRANAAPRPPVVPMTEEKRERLENAGWKVGGAEEFLDGGLDIDDVQASSGLDDLPVFPAERLRTLDDYRQEMGGDDDDDGKGYQVGIFSEPLGSDHDADQRRQNAKAHDRDRDLELQGMNERVQKLESIAEQAKLINGAPVEIIDGVMAGCSGTIHESLYDGAAFVVAITWAPHERRKCVGWKLTFMAEQLKVVS